MNQNLRNLIQKIDFRKNFQPETIAFSLVISLFVFSPSFFRDCLFKYTLVKLLLVFLIILTGLREKNYAKALILTLTIYTLIILIEYMYNRILFYQQQEEEKKFMSTQVNNNNKNTNEDEMRNEMRNDEMYVDSDNDIIF